MMTTADASELHRFMADFYESGRVVAIVCYATCTLLKTRLSDSLLLGAGKSWMGFAGDYVGRKIKPFWIEKEAHTMEGTNVVVSAAFCPHAIRDGRLIAGQQRYLAAAAELGIEVQED